MRFAYPRMTPVRSEGEAGHRAWALGLAGGGCGCGDGGLRCAYPPYGGPRMRWPAGEAAAESGGRENKKRRGDEATGRRRQGRRLVVGFEPYGSCLPLLPQALGAQPGEALYGVVAVDEAVEPGGKAQEAGRGVDAGPLPEAGPWLRDGGQAEKFAGPEAYRNVETVFGVGQHALDAGAGLRVVEEPETPAVILEAENGDAQEPAEAVVIPQQRPCPGKEAEDDPGQLHAGQYRRGLRGWGKLVPNPRGSFFFGLELAGKFLRSTLLNSTGLETFFCGSTPQRVILGRG